MRRILTNILFVLLCLLVINIKGATAQHKADTLELAKQLRNEKKLKEAFDLLQKYQKRHPKDINAIWLSAQTAYWMKDNKKSKEIYSKALKLDPNNNYLKFDYAKMLFEINDYESSKPLLTSYLQYDSLNAEALVMLAKMYYWKGDYKTAKTYLAKVYYSDPNNKNALSLIYEINAIYYVTDTIETAKVLRDKSKFKEAYDLLIKFSDAHPTNLDAAWLSAQTAYWMHDIKAAKAVYERAIEHHPDNYNLKIDYANLLFSQGDLDKAKSLFESYLTHDNDNPQVLMNLAKIALWSGNLDEARVLTEKILKNKPTDKDAKALLHEIVVAKAPWLNVSTIYSKDDQPLKLFNTNVEGGCYINTLFAPSAKLQRLDFSSDDGSSNVNWLHLANKSKFNKPGLELYLEAGLLSYPNNNGSTFSYDVKLTKTITKHLYLAVEGERTPYFYTKSSLNTKTIQNNFNAMLVLDNTKSWNGKIIYKLNQYNDNNTVSTLGAWIITPPLKLKMFEFSLGYGFNYSSAKENCFETVQSSAEVIANYYAYQNITGYYNPYFTPNSFQSHAIIVSALSHVNSKLDVGVSCSYGLYSTTQNPYFYLDKDANNTIYVAKAYEQEKFTPLNLKVYSQYQLTKKMNLRLEYTYNNTIFYSVNYVGLGLQMSFYNEKK